VSDVGGVVDRFSSQGVWEKHVSEGLSTPFQLTVDQNAGPLEGDIYVAGLGAGAVYRLSPELKLEEEITGLESPQGVAVNLTGDIFVAQTTGNIAEFNSAGVPINASGSPDSANAVVEGLSAPRALAVDSSGNLWIATVEGTVEYTFTGSAYEKVEPILDPSNAGGIALTAAGNVLTDLHSEFLDYKRDGALLGSGGLGSVEFGWGIAVNIQTNYVYVADRQANAVHTFEEGTSPESPTTEGAVATGATSFVLHGSLAGNTIEYHFAYNVGESCEGGSVTPTVAASGGAVQAEVTGLEASTQYSFCLVATNTFGSTPGTALSFETGNAPPEITGEQFSNVGAYSASVIAQLNPENSPGHYYFEYAPESLPATASVRITPEIGYAAQGSVTASAELSGLRPGSEYHFRLVGVNTRKEIGLGGETAFRTLPAATTVLPDGRVFEMVSPPDNSGADIYYPQALKPPVPRSEGIPTELPFQVAQDGSAVAYMSDPTSGGTGKGGKGLGNQYLARRLSAMGWVQGNIQPAGRLVTYYRGFAPKDLSTGVVSSGNPGEPQQPPLSVQAPREGYNVLYVCGYSAGPCSTPSEVLGNPYQPLYATPLNRKPGEFNTREAGHPIYITEIGESIGPVFAGTSADSGDLLFEADDALPGVEGPLGTQLEEDALEEFDKKNNSDYLYDWKSGRLSVVDVLPDGDVASNATLGGPSEEKHGQPDFTRAISSDGGRVFWTDLSTGVIYARVDGASTVQISAGTSTARYWAASADGRYVFYTEGEGEGSALYRFDMDANGGAQRVTLANSGADVLGVLGASEDGRDAYFVANGVLTPEANGEGVSAEAGQPNLYLSRDGQRIAFVATLSKTDGQAVEPFFRSNAESQNAGDWTAAPGHRTAEVAGDGEVVFMSHQRLASVGFSKGYPNGGLEEVYLYSPNANRLFCVSCSSTGEIAPGSADSAAAFLPISWFPTYMPQWITDEGNRVFFDSVVPLVAQDTDGRIDPYEWEREGTGTCTSDAAVDGGCVYLLSNGSSESASWLIGASSNGDDVFVVSRAQLSPEDQNETFDLYDARVGGVRPSPPPACTGSGCQGVPAAAPLFATPPSVTASEIESISEPKPDHPGKPHRKKHSKTPSRAQMLKRALKACSKRPARQRAACRVQARRRFGNVAKVGRKERGGR
jgi:hypothetical protein